MRRRRHRRGGRPRVWLRVMVALILVLAVSAILIDSQLRPIIQKAAAYHANLAAVNYINEAVSDTLAMEDISYEDIVTVDKNEENAVTALHTNTAIVNRIKTRANDSIRKALGETGGAAIQIPAGTLTENSFLIGRGPMIEIQLQLTGTVLTQLSNRFEEAGLNQTCHQIMLEVTADIWVVIPWYRTKTEVKTNYCIAETVIVGKVPDAYTHVVEGGSGIAGQIADYGAVQQDSGAGGQTEK